MTSGSGAEGARVLRLRTPEDVLAQVPFLLGVHPQQSLVAICFKTTGPQSKVVASARLELPAPDVPDEEVLDVGLSLAANMTRNGVAAVILVAYATSRNAAEPTLGLTRAACLGSGIQVRDSIIADGERYYSPDCDDPNCCPPEGTPYDLSSNHVTAEWVYQGQAVFDDDAAVRASLAPAEEADVVDVRDETFREVEKLGERRDECDSEASADALNDRVADEGVQYVHSVLRDWEEAPRQLTAEEAARISVYLRWEGVRDTFLDCTQGEGAGRLEFWRQVARQAVPPLRPAPYALLGIAAWLGGNGISARIAADLALEVRPDYTLAQLLQLALAAGMPPSDWKPIPSSRPAAENYQDMPDRESRQDRLPPVADTPESGRRQTDEGPAL